MSPLLVYRDKNEPGFVIRESAVIMMLLEEITETCHEISNNVVCATSKGSDQTAHTRSLIRALTSRLNFL